MLKRVLFVTICSIYLHSSDINLKELEAKAKNGDSLAQYQLGLIYNNGDKEKKIKPDIEKALKWYEKSAKQGNRDAMLAIVLLEESQNKLKSKRNESNNIEIKVKKLDLKDTALFNKLVKKAEKGDAKAQYQLGLIYNNGYGVKQDRKIALSWYKKSSKQGYKDAILALKILEEANSNN